ncbi:MULTISPECIES: NlpC/P60 family protein [unclassified Crossiella]|uniref:C40 family peptidase n=1 Tax=unclassified Crossiella TaxID=2620835 RepID=UPI001FFF55CD|nr:MULTISPECIES: NlpC/P60 family protein [unclassified Crossiella]MCK2238147.1 bifunctional lytic transglycosylase/C40 family peptidase [Crossiella sp. S99.2]MCK2256187.1 bifunctional lytic transglycosylase/C40 family peptidase [Crossiella sp. S99.1]
MILKVGAIVIGVILFIPTLIGNGVSAAISALFGSGNSQPSATALADIPADYLALYRAAAGECPGLDWSILAAIGKIESDHGRSPLPGVHSGENGYGAGGPMQFKSATFDGVLARHQIPPGGASPPSRYNPHDAIYAAAFMLCDDGVRRGDLRAAIFAYNHADWYVKQVLDQAKQYADAAATVGTGDCNAIQATNAVAVAAINYACGQRGLPYVWGGNGPDGGHAGFDCSGLTKAAYAAAGVTLPRTAQTQFNAGPHVPAGQPLLPGDLVFYGTPNNIHHVGLYIGGGSMVDAPDFGQVVKVQPYRYKGDDYAGATRPAGSVVA